MMPQARTIQFIALDWIATDCELLHWHAKSVCTQPTKMLAPLYSHDSGSILDFHYNTA